MTFKFKPHLALLTVCLAILSLTSCESYKKIPYFQDLDKSKVTTEDITNYTPHIIQSGDELLIHVSSLNPDADAPYNNTLQTSAVSASIPLYDYLVDQKGEIKLHSLGMVKVTGLTTEELVTELNQQLTPFLKEPKTSVRVINFKVAVLGDVARPNIYNSYTERLTITEALSLAGDLNITANRDDILVVREKNGKREFFHVDLTSKNIFDSPYYYLKSNDMIVVNPGKLKLSTIESSDYRNASLFISSLSIVTTILYLILHK